MIPGDTDEKTDGSMKETLMSKYPEAKYVDVCSLIKFDHYPTLIITIVPGEIVER